MRRSECIDSKCGRGFLDSSGWQGAGTRIMSNHMVATNPRIAASTENTISLRLIGWHRRTPDRFLNNPTFNGTGSRSWFHYNALKPV